jgi:hypothetical protein
MRIQALRHTDVRHMGGYTAANRLRRVSSRALGRR